MSCPDHRRLSELLAAERPDLAARRRAIDHLRGCAACRRAVLAADPSNLFLLLPEPATTPAEVAQMGRTVAALRRVRALERRSAGRRARLPRVAAAGLLAAGLALLAGGGAERPAHPPQVPPSSVLRAAELLPAPLIENLDRPQARIYQLTEEDLSVVMIVDESLEI